MILRTFDAKQAKLVSFHTKNGNSTLSPYEAQVWKEKSNTVYAQIIDTNNNTIDVHVKKIIFKRKYPVRIVTTIKREKVEYELINTRCDTRALHYDALFFMEDNGQTPKFYKDISEKCFFASPSDVDCQKLIAERLSARKKVSVYYVDDADKASPTYGVIPHVKSYDREHHLINTDFEKIFIVQR